MKRFVFFVCLCGMLLGFTSCEKKDTSWSITIYGNVVEESGNLISNVQVSVTGFYHKGSGRESTSGYLSGISSVTGADGTYEMVVSMPSGSTDAELDIVAEKNGYYSAKSSLYVTPDMSETKMQKSFTMRKNE